LCPHAISAPRRPQAHRRTGWERARIRDEAAADGTLLMALARAWRWQRLLDEGVFTSISEIGDAENFSKSYVSRILRLALLAPDMVEAILAGQADQALMLERLEKPLPLSWEEQRDHLGY
jgi:ParB-like chromosome segregation protein Spo0J